MTISEKKCQNMADVCELAHKRTIRDCKKQHIRHTIDIDFGTNKKYTDEAQEIFNRHYDNIIEVTKI